METVPRPSGDYRQHTRWLELVNRGEGSARFVMISVHFNVTAHLGIPMIGRLNSNIRITHSDYPFPSRYPSYQLQPTPRRLVCQSTKTWTLVVLSPILIWIISCLSYRGRHMQINITGYQLLSPYAIMISHIVLPIWGSLAYFHTIDALN